MCGGPEHLKSSSTASSSSSCSSLSSSSAPSSGEREERMNHLSVEATEDSFSSLFEYAANDDIDAFKCVVENDPSKIDDVGLWYGRQKGTNQMVLEQRTPLMVASIYGSIDVLSFILSIPGDVNRACGPDKSTALHCAAAGGSTNAVEAVNLLLKAGADPNAVDALGRRPFDVIMVSPKLPHVRTGLEVLLSCGSTTADGSCAVKETKAGCADLCSSSPPLSSSPDGCSSASISTSSPVSPAKFVDPAGKASSGELSEKKEYPVDPSLPDIKNSIYTTDEFRMFSFKVRPCSRAYSHDWTECPFVHPGENARRRDPRKFHYSCVPCPDFRKGACRRGDLCEYAHGVFECWLHPAQYRTRLCKDGTNCTRRVCFFAHTSDELRPLYVSTGSAVPSPRSSASNLDMAAAMANMNLGPPGSPSSSMSIMSPFSQAAVLTPPMSPSGGVGHSSMAWPQPNVPTLHLPGSNLQSSRLRSSLSARDIPTVDDMSMLELDAAHQLLNDFSCISGQSRMGSAVAAGNGSSLSARSLRCKTLTPSNLEELFASEMSSSPRFSADFSPLSPQVQSSQKAAASVFSQIQQQQQQNQMLSPINTGNVFSQKSVESQLNGHSLLQSSFGLSSSSRMSSPRSIDASAMAPQSPLGLRLAAFAQREKQQQQLRSHSSRDLGSAAAAAMIGSPVATTAATASPWSKWGAPTGKADWGVQGEDIGAGRFRRSSSFELGSGSDEPDVSWVHSLVKESPEIKEPGSNPPGKENPGQVDAGVMDHSQLGAWLEQMQLDQLVV
ncbi:zinc finger CCCH domain-containing protein 30-like [Nymphaea colorata]|uniref:C3H1-type domain-containing protein n=1 Tax=Nymphaea colorata TaxID=210225 RepID=A0A5K0XJ22_9MAGN|nr:zinc finger CCCH domain-containing protein 30-like [Nymphaea colorata]XP_031500094.1 zinc finger CCCH domain-containing protein 30-like [Nymphaea colorata]XP_031500095.1 zinc finger CCCH domain-containing protein 30-like [Nymphaea colorata]XP_031500096.1 zinc finger CCCH domain-containing protein 30-like [Nymphaea colorata]XP_031500098.1 zinc finger CCCH domain-containing protein 30-like [Nymphaea colorata]XP_031500099.1 zinc finger CCCH domain-containing protein 30-like [Nymphaea colorata]